MMNRLNDLNDLRLKVRTLKKMATCVLWKSIFWEGIMKGYEMSNEYNSKINQTGVVRSAYALGFKSIFYFVSVPASTPVLAACSRSTAFCAQSWRKIARHLRGQMCLQIGEKITQCMALYIVHGIWIINGIWRGSWNMNINGISKELQYFVCL